MRSLTALRLVTLSGLLVMVTAFTNSPGPAHYHDRKSVHLAPVDVTPMVRLRKSITAQLRSVPALRKLGVHHPVRPRLTIAHHLDPARFEVALHVLNMPIHSEELVRTLVLLRGDQRPGGKHERVSTFSLEPELRASA